MVGLSERVADEEIEAAVVFGSMEPMSKLEPERHLQKAPLRLRKGGATHGLRLRKAKAGRFRADLTPDQVARIEQQLPTWTPLTLGYRSGA